MDKQNYILRRRQVHGVEDRMTYLSYDRNRFGDKYPTKKEFVKGGKVVKEKENKMGPKQLKMSKNGGWEQDVLVNKKWQRDNKSALTLENLGQFEAKQLGISPMDRAVSRILSNQNENADGDSLNARDGREHDNTFDNSLHDQNWDAVSHNNGVLIETEGFKQNKKVPNPNYKDQHNDKGYKYGHVKEKKKTNFKMQATIPKEMKKPTMSIEALKGVNPLHKIAIDSKAHAFTG